MPRPSLKDQRSQEILDAFVTCAASYGLEGATQERIADAAGVKRTLLRHYLGNRDDMIDALCAHVVGEFDALTRALAEALRGCARPTDIIDLLLDPDAETDPRLVLVFQALAAAVEKRPQMRDPLLGSLQRFVDLIGSFLRKRLAQAAPADCEAAAHGLAALYMTLDALGPLSPPCAWRAAQKRAATLILASLERAAGSPTNRL